jgi:sugar phosphate permease
MSERMVDRINFAKIVTVLAIVFGISLGLCGVTAALSSTMRGGASVLVFFGIVELIAMACSAVGLVVTVIVWVLASMFGGAGAGRGGDGPQKLFDDANDAKHGDRR